jgi:hypothetical protein
MPAKKKMLPKNFEELLVQKDFDKLKAVFDTCDVNARGGIFKVTAIAFDLCPDKLTKWLVANGADLQAADSRGNTPLHMRAHSRRSSFRVLLELGADPNSNSRSLGTPLHNAAASFNAKNAGMLIEFGAKVDAKNMEKKTPLEVALERCNNADIENMVELAELLLSSGAAKTPKMKEYVENIGKNFEFHRSAFNKRHIKKTDDALNRLYKIFVAAPAPQRAMHDGKSPITVKSKKWPDQHQELWELLVPSSGHAETLQGEAVRIAGRITNELRDNGGCNWDADYKKMADAFLAIVGSGKPLSPEDLAEATSLVADVKRKSGNPERMAELAIRWVLQNPKPLKLPKPEYKR